MCKLAERRIGGIYVCPVFPNLKGKRKTEVECGNLEQQQSCFNAENSRISDDTMNFCSRSLRRSDLTTVSGMHVSKGSGNTETATRCEPKSFD